MNLKSLRQAIDRIDNQLLELLNERMKLVKQVGELKHSTNSIIYRPEREKAILDRLKTKNNGLLNDLAIDAIFLEIFAVSRNLEMPERVAYLGPNGSFSHQAAESRFGAMSEYLPIGSIKMIFESIETGGARFGVIPIENNQEGVVPETVDCLSNYDLKIVAEVPMDIHFSFASNDDNLKNIQKIFSKDIAFRQCKNFIDQVIGKPSVEMIPVDSTSKAARMALENENSGAICSHIAAKEYNLPILFENIEDSHHNQTRFIIVSKDFINEKSGNDKTSILAKIPHTDEPGSLANFLQDFNKEGINLTKIESRPAKSGKTFKYWFFIDFEGHFRDENVARVMAKHKRAIKWLGSYVRLC